MVRKPLLKNDNRTKLFFYDYYLCFLHDICIYPSSYEAGNKTAEHALE